MVVSLEESPPLPRKRQPVRAEGGEDVKAPVQMLKRNWWSLMVKMTMFTCW